MLFVSSNDLKKWIEFFFFKLQTVRKVFLHATDDTKSFSSRIKRYEKFAYLWTVRKTGLFAPQN